MEPKDHEKQDDQGAPAPISVLRADLCNLWLNLICVRRSWNLCQASTSKRFLQIPVPGW